MPLTMSQPVRQGISSWLPLHRASEAGVWYTFSVALEKEIVRIDAAFWTSLRGHMETVCPTKATILYLCVGFPHLRLDINKQIWLS